MSACVAAIVWAVLVMPPLPAGAQPPCAAPVLGEQQLKDIIARERRARNDLPPAFPEYQTTVRRQGCHYVLIEYSLPRTPESQHTFRLNQHGVIVDVQPAGMRCPEPALTESQLAEIVRNARATRTDLPAPYAESRTRVARMGCLHTYFEYPVPGGPGRFQVFTIDPLGELIEAYRNKP
jgi:hypothetical protein